MKNVHIKIHFPYNLWDGRKIKFSEDGKMVGSILSETEGTIIVQDDTTRLSVSVDIYGSKIELPKGKKDIYLIIYKKLSDGGFLIHQFDSLNFRSLKGKVVSREEYDEFDSSFYANNQRWLEPQKLNRLHLYIALMIGVITLIYSIFRQTDYNDLLFLLGGGITVSMIIILIEKGKYILGDYRLRIFATFFSIIFTVLIIPNADYALKIIIATLTFLFYASFIKAQKQVRD